MISYPRYPGTLLAIVTFGILRAKWVADVNKQLGRGGAGFLFAWFLQPFANYGITGRLNAALAQAGSGHSESPILVFLLSGWPFIGSKKRLGRATDRLNDALRVRQSAQVQG